MSDANISPEGRSPSQPPRGETPPSPLSFASEQEGTVDGHPALIRLTTNECIYLPGQYRLYRFLDGTFKVRDLRENCVYEPRWQAIPSGAVVGVQRDTC